MNADNLSTMLRVQWRTGWKVLLAWVLTQVLMMAMTVSAMQSTYNTPELVAGYRESIGEGPAMHMMNGRTAGLDTMGGIVANEFGFIVSFVLPLMGIALVSRSTRREEEAGRQELLLASSIGRHAPLVAALLMAGGATLVMALGCWATGLPTGVDRVGMLWYVAGCSGIVLFFAGIAAVAAQLFENNRGVWMTGLVVALLAMIVRGIGAVNDAWYGLLSPLGLMDGIRSFGEPRAWPLLVLLVEAVVLMAVAMVLNTRRDLGGAVFRSGAGPRQASRALRTPWGLAFFEHRGGLVGWVLGGMVIMAIYGSLAQPIMDALESNEQLQVYVRAALDAVLAMFVMMAAMLAAGAAIAMTGPLAADESTGRLEVLLSGPRGRRPWLARHLVVVSAGALVVLLVGGATLAATASWSLGNDSALTDVLRGSVAQIPAVLAFSGLALCLWACVPRLRSLAWALFGASFFIGYMGEALRFPAWLVDNSPFLLAGQVPVEPVDWTGVAILSVVAVVTHVLALVGLGRRDIPR